MQSTQVHLVAIVQLVREGRRGGTWTPCKTHDPVRWSAVRPRRRGYRPSARGRGELWLRAYALSGLFGAEITRWRQRKPTNKIGLMLD